MRTKLVLFVESFESTQTLAKCWQAIVSDLTRPSVIHHAVDRGQVTMRVNRTAMKVLDSLLSSQSDFFL